MYPDRSSFLCKSDQRFLYIIFNCHHKVSQFIDHHHYIGEDSPFIFAPLIRNNLLIRVIPVELDLGVFKPLIKFTNGSNSIQAQQFISALHLYHCPFESSRSFIRISHYTHAKMWECFICRKFHHLGIKHEKIKGTSPMTEN